MNRKRIILAALLGVLAICLAYAYFATPRLEKAPPRSVSKRVKSTPAKASGKSPSITSQDRIDFDYLMVDTQEFPGAERDVFRFGQKRAVKTEVVVNQPSVRVEVPVEVIAQPEPVDMVPIEIVQQSLSKFTFLGFLDKAGEKTVFLSSRGDLFLVKRGEKFGSDLEFTVEDISENLLQVRHAGRDGLIETPLIEQQKLSASVSSPAHLPAERAVSQPKPRVFNPKRRMLRPTAPQGSETGLPEMIEQDNPEEGQEETEPAEGDDLEGDVNGSNQ